MAQQGGTIPPDFEFKFRPINRPDDKTQAEMHLIQAQADAVYLNGGVITPQEVRESRFGSDEFSTHTTLSPEGETLLEEMEQQKAEFAASLSNAGSGNDEGDDGAAD